ncbi:MAG TPA: hypothetical protein VGE97_04360 [Nitrososphaera sp.]|jgi:hypothetical protein
MPHNSNPANDPYDTNYPFINTYGAVLSGVVVVGRNDGTNLYYKENYPRVSTTIIPVDEGVVIINQGGGVSVYSRSV